jgi:hypothetical protein
VSRCSCHCLPRVHGGAHSSSVRVGTYAALRLSNARGFAPMFVACIDYWRRMSCVCPRGPGARGLSGRRSDRRSRGRALEKTSHDTVIHATASSQEAALLPVFVNEMFTHLSLCKLWYHTYQHTRWRNAVLGDARSIGRQPANTYRRGTSFQATRPGTSSGPKSPLLREAVGQRACAGPQFGDTNSTQPRGCRFSRVILSWCAFVARARVVLLCPQAPSWLGRYHPIGERQPADTIAPTKQGVRARIPLPRQTASLPEVSPNRRRSKVPEQRAGCPVCVSATGDRHPQNHTTLRTRRSHWHARTPRRSRDLEIQTAVNGVVCDLSSRPVAVASCSQPCAHRMGVMPSPVCAEWGEHRWGTRPRSCARQVRSCCGSSPARIEQLHKIVRGAHVSFFQRSEWSFEFQREL